MREPSPPAARSVLARLELALGAVRAIERQLGRLVICQVGREAILLIRPPDQPELDAAGDQSDLLGGSRF
jgi:hypothetical protein